MSSLITRSSAPIALLAIWLLTHRYFGIQHDGVFYAVQALAHIDPTAYSNDIFFAPGSQDNYSLFSRLYAALIAPLGLDRAAFVLLVGAHVAWALAATVLARQLAKGAAAWIGLALLFALPGYYGSQAGAAHDIFRYGESFLTARSWAEPLVLAAVAATLANQSRLALAAMALAFICHPIMALPGMFFLAAFWLRPGTRAIGLCAALAAALAFLLPPMDAAWLGEVRLRMKYVLLDTWTWGELLEPLTWIGILLAASARPEARLRAAFQSLAISGAAGIYLAALGTLSHAALLIQTQPWRCIWLLKATALLALVAMFAERWRQSAADRWLLAALAASALTAQTLGGPVAMALALVAHRAWRDGRPPDIPRWLPVAGYAALAVTLLETLLAFLQQAGILAQRVGELLSGASLMPKGDLAAFLQGPLGLALPVGFALMLKLQMRRPQLALAIAALAAGAAATGWQRANDPLHEFAYSTHPARPFAGDLARTETVYWHGSLVYTWFVLRQSHYASTEQGVSALFSRQAATESTRRQRRLADFETANRSRTDAPARLAALHELCRDAALDAVVITPAIDGLAGPSWIDPLRQVQWHLYRCATLRAEKTDTASTRS